MRVYLWVMIARHYVATATALIAASILAALAGSSWGSPSGGAGTAGPPPARVAVENCKTSPGWGRRDDFTRRTSLVVGPLAIRNARPVLTYAPTVSGNKVILSVKSGHRVTLEVPPAAREDAAIGFALTQDADWRSAPRAVRFIACRRGQRSGRFDGWPVTSWVGFLFASSPRCVPLLVWVDDEPNPRRTVIRFGVRDCGVRAPEQPTLCTAGEVEALVGRFVGAFNKGDAGELDDIFAREPEFEWYSTDAPGERLTPLANDRPSLVPYFRDRHALSEQLKLGSFTFNGNTTGSRPYGNFVYTLTRSADDLGATPYRGKGAALCYRSRSDVIFVWSMSAAR